ncbi:MAG: 50S ribosomal protein L30e [Candidatus Thermoplasmatota archaeon]
MVDVNQALKEVASKGKMLLGEKQTKAAIKNKTAKLVVLANNCPYSAALIKDAEAEKIPIYHYQSDNIELGYICGKSYGVAALAVVDVGDTNILQLVGAKKKK